MIFFAICALSVWVILRYAKVSWIKPLAIFLIVNKGTETLYRLIQGQWDSIPIEYSTITYFVLPLVILFNIEDWKRAFAFMGLLSSSTYLVSFFLTGQIIYENNGLYNTVQGFINHSVLLGISFPIMREKPFKNTNKLIWIGTLIMILYMVIVSSFIDYSNKYLFIAILLTDNVVIDQFKQVPFFGIIAVYYLIACIIYQFIIKGYLFLCNLEYKREQRNQNNDASLVHN